MTLSFSLSVRLWFTRTNECAGNGQHYKCHKSARMPVEWNEEHVFFYRIAAADARFRQRRTVWDRSERFEIGIRFAVDLRRNESVGSTDLHAVEQRLRFDSFQFRFGNVDELRRSERRLGSVDDLGQHANTVAENIETHASARSTPNFVTSSISGENDQFPRFVEQRRRRFVFVADDLRKKFHRQSTQQTLPERQSSGRRENRRRSLVLFGTATEKQRSLESLSSRSKTQIWSDGFPMVKTKIRFVSIVSNRFFFSSFQYRLRTFEQRTSLEIEHIGNRCSQFEKRSDPQFPQRSFVTNAKPTSSGWNIPMKSFWFGFHRQWQKDFERKMIAGWWFAIVFLSLLSLSLSVVVLLLHIFC